MAQQQVREVEDTTTVQGRFKSSLELLEHTLNCLNPECLLPHCVNMKLAMKHTQGCKKIYCQVCHRMKSLASKHAESCDDLYCCIPFCMEEKLKGFVQSHASDFDFLEDAAGSRDWQRRVVTEDVSSGCEVPGSYPTKASKEIPRNTESRPSASGREFKGDETAINQKASMKEILPPLRLRTNTYPPEQLKRMHLSGPSKKPAWFAKSSCLRQDQSRCQSSANEKVTMTTTQVDSSMGPLPNSHEGLVTTGTPKPLLVDKGSMQKNAVTKQKSWKELSFLSPVLQDKNFVSHQPTQSTITEIHDPTDQLNTSFFSSGAEVSHSVPRTTSICACDSRDGVITVRDNCDSRDGVTRVRDNSDSCDGVTRVKSSNTQTLLKARLIDALYSLLRLEIPKLETREELVVCIKSLRKAVHDMKTLE